jgi:undecaprenyl-diphosphatase
MNLNFFQSLLIGFVSGVTQILPVSSDAHRSILNILSGIDQEDAVFRLLVHTACLIAVWSYYGRDLRILSRTNQMMKIPPKRRKKPLDTAQANTVRLLKTASVMVIICRFLTMGLQYFRTRLDLLPIGLLITGCLLLVPSLVRNGNMDSRNMPRFNGILMGIGSGLGFIPGFSSVGCAMSLGQWQGVDRSFAFRFACYLLVPVLGCHIVSDLLSLIGGNAAAFSFAGLLSAAAGAAASGFGCSLALQFLDKTVKQVGLTAFSYYCWGCALVSIALYLCI